MKKLNLLFVIVFFTFSLFGQDFSDPQNMHVNYTREAEYPGGMMKLVSDIWSLMEFTQEAVDAKVDGEIMVSFDVLPDSTVSGIYIISGLGYGIDEEFKRVLSELKFIPALAETNPVKMNMMLNIPIRVGINSKIKK